MAKTWSNLSENIWNKQKIRCRLVIHSVTRSNPINQERWITQPVNLHLAVLNRKQSVVLINYLTERYPPVDNYGALEIPKTTFHPWLPAQYTCTSSDTAGRQKK